MLLPSAFPCEGSKPAASRSTRPSLPSFAIYTPSATAKSQNTETTLSSSCRALHTILGNPVRASRPNVKSTKPHLREPFNANVGVTSPRDNRAAIPRGSNKRGRNEFEEDLQNTHYDASLCELSLDNDIMSTPKRRRRIPLEMPLGLSAADFEALVRSPLVEDRDESLSMPELSHDCLSDSEDEVDSGYGASNGPSPNPNTVHDPLWTLDDDRILVETVLEKLQLSKRAWNDCARRLGKDKDSIGRRWRLLVDEGEVGLKIRRGGPVRRTLMEVPGW